MPLGLQAGTCGGSQIDRELFKIIVSRAQKNGIVWKDDPIKRMEMKQGAILLRVEDAKIKLSEAIAASGVPRLTDDYSHISTEVVLPKGEFHPDLDVKGTLTGEDLKTVIREMWRRYYGHLIIETVNEAKERLMSALKVPLDRLDKVLVAGGSSRLPFMREEIQTVLPTLVRREDIIKGSDIGEAVAYGIAWECREQVRRDANLSVGKIAPCVLKDLYLGFRETRREPVQLPRIRSNDGSRIEGQLMSAPFETEDSVFKYNLDLPFDPSDRLLYLFSDKPISKVEDNPDRLNLTHDIFSLPKLRLNRKCELELEVKPNGMVKPTFWFHGKGQGLTARKIAEKITCPEFYFAGFQAKEGDAYVGLDFGNSNSYLVKFASIQHENSGAEYPEFTISPRVKDRLRRLEMTIQELRAKNVLTEDRLMEQALDEALEIIFHSNKIEGSPLTRGETETVLTHDRDGLSIQELEAKNLETAYYWMLENFKSVFDRPEAFVREINRLILRDVKPNGGQYRTDKVSLSGMNFVPPQASSVPAFMGQLSDEIKSRGVDRSQIEFATSLHSKLVWIHPFTDGNGRTARLLLNACLLAQELPVVVVNYADRERYLHCLLESNTGNLSLMVEFFLEGFREQLQEVSRQEIIETDEAREDTERLATIQMNQVQVSAEATPGTSEIDEAILEVTRVEPPQPPSYSDEIFEVLDKASEQVGGEEVEDLLTIVMAEKIREREKLLRADYEAWNQSFIAFLAELQAVAQLFNHKYAEVGFTTRLREYDLLTYEKYDDFRMGKKGTKTWFANVSVSNQRSREKMMFQFEHATRSITEDPAANQVSLIVNRLYGSIYRPLQTEPITLREIGYRDGELLFVSKDGIIPMRDVRQVLRIFLAELIRAFL
ncbi:MAG TPA: Fic family protein [Pyrinomonadaceae bacterium]|nr:Fic family protein [Pyrinomonadaceae bacterium]